MSSTHLHTACPARPHRWRVTWPQGDRVMAYLDHSTRRELIATVERELLASHSQTILDKGVCYRWGPPPSPSSAALTKPPSPLSRPQGSLC